MCLATDTPKRNRIQEKKNTLKGVDEEVIGIIAWIFYEPFTSYDS